LIQIFSEHPILLLFVVASIGYLIGSIKIKGGSLGVAAVLFTGLAFGAIDERLYIPEILLLLGLSIFVYTIGLSSGPAFFKSYKKNGLRDFTFAMTALLFSGLIACGLWFLFGFSAATITGIYAGSTTNTASLAGVIDYVNTVFAGQEAKDVMDQLVIGYSFSYPMGVLGGMIAIILMERFLKISYSAEAKQLRKEYPIDDDLSSLTVKITNPEISDIPLRELFKKYNWNVVFGRIYQNDQLSLSNWDKTFEVGDLAMIVGNKAELDEVITILGEKYKSTLDFDHTLFDVRRIFVSNSHIVGRTIASLNIPEKYNAIVTRIRRGDIDMLARGNTVLELGDRIRFIAHRKDLKQLSKYFGDSYEASSKMNLFSFGLGIGLGLILGTISFNLAENFTFKLGYAGGPLIVGLLLGALRRTGKLVWTLPYSVNIALQQLGLILLLAAIGVKSGQAFANSFSMFGLSIFAASTVISLTTALMVLFVGYRFLKLPFSLLMGMVANQPAIYDFAANRAKNGIPMFGYTMMFPIALISKILIAQLLFMLLSS